MAQRRPQAKATVQIDNERVIVTEWRFSSGAETGWHRHNCDYTVVPLSTGELLLETSESNKIAELVAGKSYFRNLGVEHNVVNINNTEFVFIEIEIK